jgi:uncharacterized membrane protein
MFGLTFFLLIMCVLTFQTKMTMMRMAVMTTTIEDADKELEDNDDGEDVDKG